jgi:flagellar motor switch protein FliN/FliY
MSESPISYDIPVRERVSEELTYFLNVPLSISIQLGVRIMKVREILKLKPGSLIELTKPADGNVEVLINGNRIAVGEVIMHKGSIGVRLTAFNAVESGDRM